MVEATKTTHDVIRALRSLHGYTRLDAERAVRDVVDVLRHLLDELEAGDDLRLTGLGRFLCVVEIHKDGGNGQAVRWSPSPPLARGHAARALPHNDARVILARGSGRRRSGWGL